MSATLSQADHGRVIAVGVGDQLLLHLPENPSTGYRWTLDPVDAAILAVTETGFTGSSTVGGGGDARWQLRANAAGDVAVSLKRWRPFEGERSVVERFAVTLHITA